MDTGRIPGSIRVKWRRLRDRADLLRLQKQTKNPRNWRMREGSAGVASTHREGKTAGQGEGALAHRQLC